MISGRLDRYVGKTVLGAWLASVVFFLLLFVLVDVLVRVGSLSEVATESGMGMGELIATLGHYYLLFLPVVFVSVGPFVTVIAAMFSIARLMGANELVPMLFTGRNLWRVLQPVFVIALLSAGLMFVAWEFAVPQLTKELNQVRAVLEGDEGGSDIENLVIKLRDGRRQTLFAGSYDNDRQRLEKIAMVDEGSGTVEDEVVVEAEAAIWNPELDDWELIGGKQITTRRTSPRAMLGTEGLTPDLVSRVDVERREVMELGYTQLLELQRLRPEQVQYVLAFHGHITFPLANFVLLMLVLPFAVHFERRSRIERVLFAILACGIYLIADLTCQSLGNGGHVHPIFAAWLPTIVFGSLGAALITGVRT